MLLQPGLSWIRLYGPTAASKWCWGRMCFRATEPWLVHYSLTLYPTGRSWQSCVHPLTRRFRHSFTLQFLSSDRSPQSSLPSQRFLSEMQRPLEHMKKEPLHKLPKKEEWDMTVTGTTPCNSSTKLGDVFDLTMDLDRLIPFKEALLVVAPFVSAICPRHFPGRVALLVTLMKRFQLRAKQQSYLRPSIWGSEAVRQSGRDSLHSRHTPTESWGDSGRPRSETPLIHRSDRLEEKRQTLFL